LQISHTQGGEAEADQEVAVEREEEAVVVAASAVVFHEAAVV
jgi:hypothetical protein